MAAQPAMKRLTASVLLIAASVATSSESVSETYPSRPIKLIVPFPAGGPLDLVGRLVTEKMAATLKQPFIFENKAGAGGNLGSEAVAKAAPDGYTLLLTLGTTLSVNPWLYKKLPFDPQADLRPLSILSSNSQMLVVHPSVPVNSIAEFVALAKKEPVAYAHAGHGSPGHLVMEYFRITAGFKSTPVPYRGNAPLVTDLIAGQIKFGFVATAGVIQHVREGRLKGLAISTSQRSHLAADVPTVAESGYPDFKVETTFVLLAPAGIPEPIAELLEREVRAALKAPDVQEKLRAQDLGSVGSTGAEAKARIKADSELWGSVVKAANMQVE